MRAELAPALGGHFAGWHGLPRACVADDFRVLAGEPGPLRAGRLSNLPALWREYPGHPGALRVYFGDDGSAYLARADWPLPKLELAGFAAPDALIDDPQGRLPGTVQRVWATRGLALFEAAGGVRAFALFVPATVEHYLQALGGNEPSAYRPRG